MRRIGPWQVLPLILLMGLGVIGCGDLVTSPEADGPGLVPGSPFFAVVEGGTLEALFWECPLSSDMTRSKKMTEKGGEIRDKKMGVRLEVPEGAIAEEGDDEEGSFGGKVEVSMTILAGEGIAFSFAPHGLSFKRPVKLVIDLAKTELASAPMLGEPLAVYFEGAPTTTVRGREVLPVQIIDGKLVVELHHFSGYLLASG